jgi:hypothetical protein
LAYFEKNTTISTPFAPKMSYIFLMAFVVIFAGGSSVLYFKTLPDSRIERSFADGSDPSFVASQNLHHFDRFLIGMSLFNRKLLPKDDFMARFKVLQENIARFETDQILYQELSNIPGAIKNLRDLTETLDEVETILVKLRPEDSRSLDLIYDAMAPFESRLQEVASTINANEIRSRSITFEKQVRSHRMLGWTLLAIAVCSILLLMISHGNIKNVALLLETSKHKSTRLKRPSIKPKERIAQNLSSWRQ